MFENRTKIIEDLRYKYPDTFITKRDYIKKGPEGLVVVYTTDAPHIMELDVSTDESLEEIAKISVLYSAEFCEAAGEEKKAAWDVVPLDEYCRSYETLSETLSDDLNNMSTSNKIVLKLSDRAYVAMSDPDVLEIVKNVLMRRVKNYEDIEGVMEASTLLVDIKKNGLTTETIEKAGFKCENVPGAVKTYIIRGTDKAKEFKSDEEVQEFLITDLMAHLAGFCERASQTLYNEKIDQTIETMLGFYRKVGHKDYDGYLSSRGWTLSTATRKGKIEF